MLMQAVFAMLHTAVMQSLRAVTITRSLTSGCG